MSKPGDGAHAPNESTRDPYAAFIERSATAEHGDPHEEIASKVYRRLRQRDLQLRKAVEEAQRYIARRPIGESQDSAEVDLAHGMSEHAPSSPAAPSGADTAQQPANAAAASAASAVSVDPLKRFSGKTEASLDPRLRAYRLAATDLFVEKAIAYLEGHARPYQKFGIMFNLLSLSVVAVGAFLANHELHSDPSLLEQVRTFKDQAISWPLAVLRFSKTFTAYGMIVLVAALLWRFGKAMLDQSERLMERRHALRQGRLFVHLNDGQLKIDEMEKAFNWNQSQSNAFANIRDDTQAPWGAVARELARGLPDLVKAGLRAKTKGDESGDGGKKST